MRFGSSYLTSMPVKEGTVWNIRLGGKLYKRPEVGGGQAYDRSGF